MTAFMIFAKNDLDNAIISKRFADEFSANDYIKNVLEPSDRDCGIFEPNFYFVKDMTRYI